MNLKKLILPIALGLFCFSASLPAHSWVKEYQILPSTPADHAQFGYSVAIDEKNAIVGAPGNGTVVGTVYFFKYDHHTKSWIEQTISSMPVIAAGDFFGWAVSIHEKKAIVGAPYTAIGLNANQGLTYIFSYDKHSKSWGYQTTLNASDGIASSYFGFSVGIHKKTAVVGAYNTTGAAVNTGAAYVFRYNRHPGTWTEEQKLLASDAQQDDEFGWSVDVHGKKIIVGAYGHPNGDNQGAAYIYKRKHGVWTEEQMLTASDGVNDDYFGVHVSIHEKRAVVGANGASSNDGAAYVFKYKHKTWNEEQILTPPAGAINDLFGTSVGVDDKAIIVGAPSSTNGTAYLFGREHDNWVLNQELTASNGASGDQFGLAVGITDDWAIVGAPQVGTAAGEAYIYRYQL